VASARLRPLLPIRAAERHGDHHFDTTGCDVQVTITVDLSLLSVTLQFSPWTTVVIGVLVPPPLTDARASRDSSMISAPTKVSACFRFDKYMTISPLFEYRLLRLLLLSDQPAEREA
jgi:hypothetical protein